MTAKESRPKVWSYLPAEIHEYFFRKIYAGDRGIKQDLIIQFFEALYYECLRHKIKAEWSIDSAKRIDDIMSRLNFDGHGKRRRITKKNIQPESLDGISD